MRRVNQKNSIVDDLDGVEKLGGVKRVHITQLYESEASYLLNEHEPEPIDFSIHKFPKIKHNETEEIKTK